MPQHRGDWPIPVIDLSKSAPCISAALHQAYSHTGFAYLINHPLDAQLITRLFAASRRFHALPLAQKMAIEVNRWHRGYLPLNTSTNRTSSIAKSRHPNQSESLMIMHETLPNDSAYLAGPNQWPAQLPALQPLVTAYVDNMNALCHLLTVHIEKALALAAGTLTRHFESPTTFLRLLHYPSQPPMDGLYGSAPHTDYGFITLLAQDDTGGLQVRDPAGQWLDVPPRPDAFIMNAGDMLQRWSHGRFLSTPHRVINRSGRERYSIAYFHDPHVDTVIEPLVTSAQPRDFPPLRYGDYLRERLEKNHLQHQTDA